MSKFQVGQQVIRTKLRFNDFKEGLPYLVTKVSEYDGIEVEGFPDGTLWDEEYFDLYQEPAQKTFNPQQGDLIVTEGEGIWVCSTVQEINKLKGISFHTSNPIVGYQRDASGYIQHQDWDEYGSASAFYTEFQIKKIIPASTNNPVDVPQSPQDLSFQVKALELENQMLRMLLRREGIEV